MPKWRPACLAGAWRYHGGMAFARWTLVVAAVYGIGILLLALFGEARVGAPAVTHPEYYYGFVASALVWQVAFLVAARDPVRFRPLIGVFVFEKAAFFVPCVALHLAGRLPLGQTFMGGMIDGVLMLLFAVAWLRLGRRG